MVASSRGRPSRSNSRSSSPVGSSSPARKSSTRTVTTKTVTTKTVIEQEQPVVEQQQQQQPVTQPRTRRTAAAKGRKESSPPAPSSSSSASLKVVATAALDDFPFYLVPALLTRHSPFSSKMANLALFLALLYGVGLFLVPAIMLPVFPALLKIGAGSYPLSAFGLYNRIAPYQRHLYRVKGCCHLKPKPHTWAGSAAALASSYSSTMSRPKLADWKNSTGHPLKPNDIKRLLNYKVSGHVLDLGHSGAVAGSDDTWIYAQHLKQLARTVISPSSSSSSASASKKSNVNSNPSTSPSTTTTSSSTSNGFFSKISEKLFFSSPLAPAKCSKSSCTAAAKTSGSSCGCGSKGAPAAESVTDTVNKIIQSIMPKATIAYTMAGKTAVNASSKIFPYSEGAVMAMRDGRLQVMSIPDLRQPRNATAAPAEQRIKALTLAKEYDFILLDFNLVAMDSEASVKALFAGILQALKPGGKLLFIEPTSSATETSYLVRILQTLVMQPLCWTLSLGSCRLNRDVIATISQFAFESVDYVYVDAWDSPYAFAPLVYGIATKNAGNWFLDSIF